MRWMGDEGLCEAGSSASATHRTVGDGHGESPLRRGAMGRVDGILRHRGAFDSVSGGWAASGMPVVKKPNRREEDREKRREQILRAASDLIARKGLENVTFGEIARKARLSRPLVYFYFPDLRTVFLEAVLRAHADLRTRFEEASGQGGTGLEKIENIGRAYARFHRESPASFQLCALFDSNPGYAGDPGVAAAGLEQSELATHCLCADAIRTGLADGSIRSDVGDPDQVAIVLWACVHGLAQLGAMRGPSLEKHAGLGEERLLEAGIGMLRRALVGDPVPGRGRVRRG